MPQVHITASQLQGTTGSIDTAGVDIYLRAGQAQGCPLGCANLAFHQHTGAGIENPGALGGQHLSPGVHVGALSADHAAISQVDLLGKRGFIKIQLTSGCHGYCILVIKSPRTPHHQLTAIAHSKAVVIHGSGQSDCTGKHHILTLQQATGIHIHRAAEGVLVICQPVDTTIVHIDRGIVECTLRAGGEAHAAAGSLHIDRAAVIRSHILQADFTAAHGAGVHIQRIGAGKRIVHHQLAATTQVQGGQRFRSTGCAILHRGAGERADAQLTVAAEVELGGSVARKPDDTGGIGMYHAECIGCVLKLHHHTAGIHQPLVGGIGRSGTAQLQLAAIERLAHPGIHRTAEGECAAIGAGIHCHGAGAGHAAGVGGGGIHPLIELHGKGAAIEHHIALVAEVGSILAGILQHLAAFHILLGVAHPLAHHIGAAALHRHIARKAGMTTQLECTASVHGHVHRSIGIVPVILMRIAVAIAPGVRAGAVDGVCASQHHGAVVHLQAAALMLQIGADAVESPASLSHIVDYLQAAVGRVGKGTRVGRIAGFLVGEGGAAAVVSHQGILGQGIDGEAGTGGILTLRSGVPVHAVAVHIQRAATVAEGQVALDLFRIVDNHRSPGIHQHIVGCIAPLPVQVGLAATAQIQQHIVIPAAFDIQIARANLAPLPHILRRIGKLQVNLCPGVDDIACVVEQIAFSLCRGNGKLPATELSIANTQIHRIIQHDTVLFCRGLEHQILREKQIFVFLRHVGLIVGIPILRIFQPAQV